MLKIRGFPVRIPLDLLLVFTANPEDYTNRGSIITPLKDRIDSQIITHYPRSIEIGSRITQREAWYDRGGPVKVNIPHYFREIIEHIAVEARTSAYVDQRSGVSVRLTRSAIEDLVSAAERRALINGETETTVRISDLQFVEPAVTGKVELVYEGEQEGPQNVARLLIGLAVKVVFKKYFPEIGQRSTDRSAFQPVIEWFSAGNGLDLSIQLPLAEFNARLQAIPGLSRLVSTDVLGISSPDEKAVAMEFVLEALHQHSLLGKDRLDAHVSYSDLMGSMLGDLDLED